MVQTSCGLFWGGQGYLRGWKYLSSDQGLASTKNTAESGSFWVAKYFMRGVLIAMEGSWFASCQQAEVFKA